MVLRLLGLSRRPPSGAEAFIPPEPKDTTDQRREVARHLVETRRRLAALKIESDMDR